jgi:hypothetical protein
LGDKTILSSVGHITLGRRYFACKHCKAKQTPWDAWAGITGKHRVTPHARRMIVLAGSRASYDEGAEHLQELSHIQVSNDVVRGVCDEEGQQVQKWLKQSPEPQKVFSAAKGEIEFSTDGLKVNTVDGWREIRLSSISKREAGGPAKAEEWEDRCLEKPTARVAICAIAPCGHIGASWDHLLKALGLPKTEALCVIADGAKWIWDQAAKRFTGKTEWIVDIYHVMLYLHAATKAMGHTTDEAKQWVGERVIQLIEMGGPKFIEKLQTQRPPQPAAAEAWEKMITYLTNNRDSLWYGKRMEKGLAIGSGLIEGGCKSILGKRLKINSARWRVRRAEHMGAIRCLQYSDLWETYWESKHAA